MHNFGFFLLKMQSLIWSISVTNTSFYCKNSISTSKIFPMNGKPLIVDYISGTSKLNYVFLMQDVVTIQLN